MKYAANNQSRVGLSQLKILSGNDDKFYAGCTLNGGAIGVERLASPFDPSVSKLSGPDRLAFSGYGRGAWSAVGCLSIIVCCNRNQRQVQGIGAEGGWRLGDVSSDPFGGVFMTFHSGIPGENVLLEVRGARRQICRQGDYYYHLEYPRNDDSCVLNDPSLLSCGLDRQFRISGYHFQTAAREPIDSHVVHKLLSTRTPAIPWTQSGFVSPGSLGHHSCETFLGLSITVQTDKQSCNIGCTPDAWCWRHVWELHPSLPSSCSVVLASLQHARCRMVVTQIPVGPF